VPSVPSSLLSPETVKTALIPNGTVVFMNVRIGT
jgi:hypothetical protein